MSNSFSRCGSRSSSEKEGVRAAQCMYSSPRLWLCFCFCFRFCSAISSVNSSNRTLLFPAPPSKHPPSKPGQGARSSRLSNLHADHFCTSSQLRKTKETFVSVCTTRSGKAGNTRMRCSTIDSAPPGHRIPRAPSSSVRSRNLLSGHPPVAQCNPLSPVSAMYC